MKSASSIIVKTCCGGCHASLSMVDANKNVGNCIHLTLEETVALHEIIGKAIDRMVKDQKAAHDQEVAH